MSQYFDEHAYGLNKPGVWLEQEVDATHFGPNVIPQDEQERVIVALCDELSEREDLAPFDFLMPRLLADTKEADAEELSIEACRYASQILLELVAEQKLEPAFLPHVMNRIGLIELLADDFETADQPLPSLEDPTPFRQLVPATSSQE